MKLLVAIVAVVVGFAGAASAQENVTVSRVGRNVYKLNLDPGQRVVFTSACLELAILDDAVLFDDRLVFSGGEECDVNRITPSGRYDFTNPGADAGDAIVRFLDKREAEKRQARRDALAAKKIEAELKDHALTRQVLEEQLKQLQELRQAQTEAIQQAKDKCHDGETNYYFECRDGAWVWKK